MTPFEHAKALCKMWEAYDCMPRNSCGFVIRASAMWLLFCESLAVVVALSRIAVAKGVLTDDEGKEAAR